MNFASHILIASMTSPSTDAIDLESVSSEEEVFLLGSALPDIASMGKVRLQRPLTHSTLESGVQNHQYADSAFHQSEWFIDRNASLTDELESAGLDRGPARACAHVGIELFLDGALLSSKPGLHGVVQNCLRRTADETLNITRSVKPERATQWQDHIERTAKWLLPSDFHQPAAVAQRLHRIVVGRPRLAFPADQISVVEEVLVNTQSQLLGQSEQLLQEVAGEVRRRTSGEN